MKLDFDFDPNDYESFKEVSQKPALVKSKSNERSITRGMDFDENDYTDTTEEHPYFGQYAQYTPSQYESLSSEKKQELQGYSPLQGFFKGILSGSTLGATEYAEPLENKPEDVWFGAGEAVGAIAPIGLAAKAVSLPFKLLGNLTRFANPVQKGIGIAKSAATGATYGTGRETVKAAAGEEFNLGNVVQDAALFGGTHALFEAIPAASRWIKSLNTEEDHVSQSAAVLLDRIVRQGRAFGIHVLLGSQTLGAAYTLARATIGQMVIRIALMCNEADAYLIMDQDNPAPRLLTRPGEGIYNDMAGSLEGNSPFQTVWLPEEVRDSYLAKIRARADQNQNHYPGPFVFEGNAPADVKENYLLNELLRRRPSLVGPTCRSARTRGPSETARPTESKVPTTARIWLGAPNSIKGPTEAVFQKQSGSNLLIVGQSEERSLTLLAVALVSLAAQYLKNAARFILLDSSPPGIPAREFLQRVIKAIPHEIVQVTNNNLAEVMAGLAEDLKRAATRETRRRQGAPRQFRVDSRPAKLQEAAAGG